MPLHVGGERIARVCRGGTLVFEAAAGPGIVLVDQAAWTGGTTSPALSFGAAAGLSLVVVAAGITKGATGADSGAITGMTIGGVTGVQAANQGAQNFSGSAIYCAEVAAASGTVTIAHGGERDAYAVFVYRLNNLASLSPADADASTAASGTLALDVPAGGIAVGHVVARLSTSTITLTNLSNDGLISAASGHRLRGGHAKFGESGTYTFSYGFSDTAHGGACVAAFR